MTRSEKHLITFISWSGTVIAVITTAVYMFRGYWFDSLYGTVSILFFLSILYLTSRSYISYERASLFFSAFSIIIMLLGYITSISVQDGLIYMIIPTIIIALLRPTDEAILWLIPYYAVFLIINVLKIPNYPITLPLFMQLFSIHMLLFIIISYFRNQERILNERLLRLNERLKEEASLDALTGVYNRRILHTVLERVIGMNATEKQDFVLALIDLDHFKKVNDNFGHQKGDEVLKNVASHFKSKIRKTDTLIRYGGEEFIICFSNIAIEDAVRTMEAIRHSVSQLSLLPDDTLTISVGIAALQAGESEDALLSRADTALYEAKAEGRNLVKQI